MTWGAPEWLREVDLTTQTVILQPVGRSLRGEGRLIHVGAKPTNERFSLGWDATASAYVVYCEGKVRYVYPAATTRVEVV